MENKITVRWSIFLTCIIMIFSPDSCNAQKQTKSSDTYAYTIETPENFNSNGIEEYPLLIFLHGAGERGSDLNMLGIHGPLKLIEGGKKFNAIVFAPLCPKDVWWDTDLLQNTLEEVKRDYKIDEAQIYLTGLSMGGYGTWLWAGRYPNQFKRIAPICGGGDIKDAERLANIPIWAFHGEKDVVVLPEKSHEMINAIKAVGGNPKLTLYPEADHDSWTQTYDNDEFWKWLLNPK